MAAPMAATTRHDGHSFYVWMAGAFIVVAFGGFTPTYWSKLVSGTFDGAPIFHIHGVLLFTWTLFYFFQTWLVASGRTVDHRSWGLAGIALFSVLMCSILVGESVVLRRDELLGTGDGARRFAAVTLCAMPLLVGLFGAAVYFNKKPQIHKRLMLLLMIAMMTPALARVFLTILAPPGARGSGAPPPPFVSLPPGLVADLFLVVAIIRDWRVRGRPHPVYVYGGLCLLAQQLLTVPFAASAVWMSMAMAFQRLSG